MSEHDENHDGRMDLCWHYSNSKDPLKAERDKDGDGKWDSWFFYEKGRLKRVEEDTNKDGKIDLWEFYEGSQRLVKTQKDLDYDGGPDITF
jgi:hypothetical protein